MARRKPTPEQKAAAAERRARMRRLAKAVSDMTDEQRSAMVDRYGAITTIEGRPLSMHNTCMLLQQDQGASIVGGFQQWRNAGRRVRKGERALAIWAPIGTDAREDDAGQDDSDRLRFRLVNIFDVRQTEPIEVAATA